MDFRGHSLRKSNRDSTWDESSFIMSVWTRGVRCAICWIFTIRRRGCESCILISADSAYHIFCYMLIAA